MLVIAPGFRGDPPWPPWIKQRVFHRGKLSELWRRVGNYSPLLTLLPFVSDLGVMKETNCGLAWYWAILPIRLAQVGLLAASQVLIHPSNAEATFVQCTKKQKKIGISSSPCRVGIHWKAVAEHHKMSTHVPMF